MTKESIEQHIKQGDFLPTVATILDLARQSFERDSISKREVCKTLAEMRDAHVSAHQIMQANPKK